MNITNSVFLVVLLVISGCFSRAFGTDTSLGLNNFLANGEYDKAVEFGADSDSYLATLIHQSRKLKLSDSPMWKSLLHYKRTKLFWIESQVDDPAFFLSSEGRYNPKAELEATIAAFFSHTLVGKTEFEPQCRFPARFYWLRRSLDFDTSRLPISNCDVLQRYYSSIDPSTLTVVFPSTHPNSPSSMFGHTLLRIDKQNQTEDTRMLAFSINYAAMIPPTQDAISYALMGLAGGFEGRFMVTPYYLKLREYGQIENRDLWEYELNIPKKDIEFVLMHAFELAFSYFDYYFFTENCSYHMLSLLDVLYNDNTMTAEYDYGWTIPVDTLKTLEQRGLVKRVKFYPSQARTITHLRSNMSQEERQVALDGSSRGVESVRDRLAVMEIMAQVRALDLLTEYQRYNKVLRSETTVSSKLTEEERKTLGLRSKLQVQSPRLNVSEPGLRPDFGHGTSRVGLAYGVSDARNVADNQYGELSWRAAYHDILDPSQGFVSNSTLSFMDVNLRQNLRSKKTVLQRLTFLDIQSLEPRDEFFKNLSWRANIRFDRTFYDESLGDGWLLAGDGGAGYTYYLVENRDDAWYGFLDFAALYKRQTSSGAPMLRIGPSTGVILEPIVGWRVHLQAKIGTYIPEYKNVDASLRLQQSISLSRNTNLRFDVAGFGTKTGLISMFVAALQYYF